MAPRSLVASDHLAFWHLDAVRGPSTPSFDHRICAAEKRQREGQAQRSRGFKIDHKLDFGRLHYWKISWSFTLEYPANVITDLPIHIFKAYSITHQTAHHREGINRGHSIARREIDDL